MSQTDYRDLAEFGLPLIPPGDPDFPELVRDIESRPQPFRPPPVDDLDRTAVLLNQSGKAVVVLAYLWRYTSAEGATRTSRISNFGSSTQMDVLNGLAEVTRDIGTFILPGSKRLLTEEGMFGNNLDVLPPEEQGRRGGFIGGGSGWGGGRRASGSEVRIVATELRLDLAIFEDGLCAGPDESGIVDDLLESFERQRSTSQQIVTALRSGGSIGQIFEILRPLARHTPPPPPSSRKHASHFPGMFANMAIRRLVDASPEELLSWFEREAQAPPLRLYRPA